MFIVGVFAVTEVDFKVSGNIEYIVPLPAPEDYSYLTFSYSDEETDSDDETEIVSLSANSAELTASVIGCSRSSPAAIEVPERIRHNDKIYTVTSIANGASWASSVFSGCSIESIKLPDTLEMIGDWAFTQCYNLTSVNIPNKVTAIGKGIFYNCTGLKNVTIPDSILSIGISAFSGCSSLQNITLPSSITKIDGMAFNGCNAITALSIPVSVNYIADNAFTYCNNLENIVVASGNTVYDSRNNCSAIIEQSTNKLVLGCINTVIPSSVVSIGNHAFEGCEFTSFVIPSQIQSVGQDAFTSCLNLSSVEIKSGVQTLAADAFYSCKKLTSIKIPNSVTEIGEYAFGYCESLTNALVGTGIKNLPSNLFTQCTKLQTIVIPAQTPPSYETGIFETCSSLSAIQVPYSKKSTYKSTTGWSGHSSIITEIPYSYYNFTFNTTNMTATLTGTAENLRLEKRSLNIPETYYDYDTTEKEYTIISIGDRAFSGYDTLTSITLPNTLNNIGEYAFRSSHLSNITIPASVANIGNNPFISCSYLETISVNSGNTNYSNQSNTLYDKVNKQVITGLSNSTIPSDCITIGNSAFYATNISNLAFPNTVKIIQADAFHACMSITSLPIFE